MSEIERNKPSLTRALGRVNIIGVAVALVISSVVLLVYEAVSLRGALADNARLQAAMVAENMSAPLLFRDSEVASEVLGHLGNLPYIESVAVFDAKGGRFARYIQRGLSESEQDEGTEAAARTQERLSFKDVVVAAPVVQGGARVGSVVLVATTEGMKAEFMRYACFLLLASACALWIASFVMSRTRARVVEAERQLEYFALTDPLTDLPNRRAFYDELAGCLRPAAGVSPQVTLVLIDLDDFKKINDTLGHGAGDELLRAVAHTLRGTVQQRDVVSRIGGDEFAVLATSDTDRIQSRRTAEKIVRSLGRSFELEGTMVPVTVSVGFSRYPDDAGDIASLLSSADIALYAAKGGGKNLAVEFRPKMTAEAQRRASLERDLREAVERDGLDIAYQPQFDCRTGRLVGVEALARWDHPSQGAISPAEFVQIAESSDLILSLGRWILTRACQDAVRWNSDAATSVSVSVNVSARQLRHHTFGADVLATLQETGLRPELLELELTESLLMENVTVSAEVMRTLRARGVRLSIDDFGTGYSSLSYLQSFPLNQLKIDRSFVKALPYSGQPIVTAIISMAHSFGLTVVAEGVEYPAQLAWLCDSGCDFVQGYLTGRPMTFTALMEALEEEREHFLAAERTESAGPVA
ncbi:putative bifunctional diguanylate cyclase/phosphodiesterase [Paraburkholderia aromaticivorans]|uniref:putative bifunctional diguanylate cyclase/phosphodiesterase n=1 Tax=Paraburkholderia aromaticivorans TaxID=2026199 RepID=UPI0038B7AC88